MKIEGTPLQGGKDTAAGLSLELELQSHNRANYARKMMARRAYRGRMCVCVCEASPSWQGWPDTPPFSQPPTSPLPPPAPSPLSLSLTVQVVIKKKKENENIAAARRGKQG